eukprot:XP_014772717.1 PREDICTED: uncharacterized protein LOC106870985 [Octopus bimaculoides]
MAAPSLNLLQLPDAILLRIFTYLPIPDVYQLSKSSPKLHCLCYDQYVVSSLHLSCFHEMSKDIYKEIISNSCRHICKLNLNHCYWLPAQVVTEMVLKCQKVTDLHLIECKLRSHQLVQILAKNQLIRLESLRVLGTPHRGLPKDMLSPLILNVNNFQRIKELAINDAADPAARIFFFGTLLELCKVDLHLKTLLKPMANLTTKPYFANIFKNMSEMENLDLSRSNIEVPMDMIKWEEAVNLRHLNLLENIKINSEQLSTLAGLCPHIVSLNLQYCISSFQALSLQACSVLFAYCFCCVGALSRCKHHLSTFTFDPVKHRVCGNWRVGEIGMELHEMNFRGKNNYPLQEDLKGLQALISSCRHLTHLNLSGIHSHYLRLKSLALSSCAVVHKHSDTREHTFNIKLDEVPAKKRRMSWMEANSPFSELSSDVNLYSTDSLSSGATTNSSCQDLETLVKGCPNMEHFELITPNFYSVFHKVLGMCTREQNFYACEPSRQLHESQLTWIGHWKNLRYLQLTGIPEIRLGTSLVSICKHCIHLERLHLAQLGLPGHITYHSNLCKALTHCKQLKDFRIEQPNMKLNETFFRSLWSCPELERVCVASNRSTYDSVLIDQLLSMASKMIVLMLFSGMSQENCKHLQSYLTKKYKPSRPALWINLFPLQHIDLKDELNSIPTKHYEELMLLRSRVSVKPVDW